MECNRIFPGKKSKFVLGVIFSLTCFFLAGYMVCSQFLAYFANEDASVVTYTMFDGDNADVYPTFTICFYGRRKGKIFRSSVNQSYYYDAMAGNLEDNNNLTSIAFEDAIIQLLPIVEKFHTITEDGASVKSVHRGLPNHSSIFSTTYHDAQYVCYTKERNVGEEVRLSMDMLTINASQMLDQEHHFYEMHFRRGPSPWPNTCVYVLP